MVSLVVCRHFGCFVGWKTSNLAQNSTQLLCVAYKDKTELNTSHTICRWVCYILCYCKLSSWNERYTPSFLVLYSVRLLLTVMNPWSVKVNSLRVVHIVHPNSWVTCEQVLYLIYILYIFVHVINNVLDFYYYILWCVSTMLACWAWAVHLKRRALRLRVANENDVKPASKILTW